MNNWKHGLIEIMLVLLLLLAHTLICDAFIITKMKVTCYELSWFFFWVSGTIENHEGMWMDVKMNITYEMCKNHYSTNLSEKVLYQNILHWWNKKFFIFWLMNKNITSNSTWITFYFYINCKNDIACKYPNRK